MKGTYFDKFVIGLIVLLIIFAVSLQIVTYKSTEKLKQEEIKKTEQYASKITRLIHQQTKNGLITSVHEDVHTRVILNETLLAFLTDQYSNIFVLSKDNNDNFRFLLDAIQGESDVYDTLFQPKSNLFNQVYDTKKMEIIHQSEGVENVWLSLVYPMVKEGKSEGLLIIDLSKEYAEHLNNFNSPLMTVIGMMQVFLTLSLFLLIFLAYRYYQQRYNLLHDKKTTAYSKVYVEEFFNRHSVDRYNAILIEVDEFMKINQKYSYEMGDALLREFTQTLKAHLHSTAKVIRTGGTEFLAVIPKNVSDVGVVESLFEALTNKRYLLDNETIDVTVSMSAVDIPEGTNSIQNIQRILDECLFDVKKRGKNNFKIVKLTNLDDVRYGNVNYIKEALEEERFVCHYQPIYETRSKKVSKFEALVRMIDKEDSNKFITPQYFMRQIKGTSQYIKMSKLVFQDVFKTLELHNNIEVSVNVDLNDLDNPEMMYLISTYLYSHREIADRLTFEILEDNEIRDYKKVQHIITQLKAYGSKVALDDFGSGYTNYHYLATLEIDILKIDGTLIRELETSPRRTKIVLESIQSLAQNLEVELVAEYVSNKVIYDALVELDIEYVQGYYLGEPKLIDAYQSE